MRLRKLLPILLVAFTLTFWLPVQAVQAQPVKVYFSPSTVEVNPDETFTVELMVDPGGLGVSAGEFIISYDAKALEAVSVEIGKFFGDEPLTALEAVKPEKGIIHYAIARKGETVKPTPEGVALTVKFKVKSQAQPKTYTISLKKVDLVDEAFNRISNPITEPCKVYVQAPTATPTTTTTPIATPTVTPTPTPTATVTPAKGRIVGKVLDEATGEPLAGVEVKAAGLTATTGSEGGFSLEVEAGTHRVSFVKEGYEEKEVTVSVEAGGETYIDVRLKPKAKPGGGCLIATAAFGGELAPQVQALRTFRDRYVLATRGGLAFLNVFNAWYYSWSPVVAEAERRSPLLQGFIRLMLNPLLAELTLAERVYASLAFNPEAAILAAGILVSSLLALTYLAAPAFTLAWLLRKHEIGVGRLPAALLASFLTLHGVGLLWAEWLLPLTSTGVILSTMALSLQAILKAGKILLKTLGAHCR